MIGFCVECDTELECLNENGVCMECDEQYSHCYGECKTPCRSKEEQKTKFDKRKPGWDQE